VKLGKRYDSWKKKKTNRKYYPGGKGEIHIAILKNLLCERNPYSRTLFS
jgi:hypothetical protein